MKVDRKQRMGSDHQNHDKTDFVDQADDLVSFGIVLGPSPGFDQMRNQIFNHYNISMISLP